VLKWLSFHAQVDIAQGDEDKLIVTPVKMNEKK
jgi:hypothetical protein